MQFRVLSFAILCVIISLISARERLSGDQALEQFQKVVDIISTLAPIFRDDDDEMFGQWIAQFLKPVPFSFERSGKFIRIDDDERFYLPFDEDSSFPRGSFKMKKPLKKKKYIPHYPPFDEDTYVYRHGSVFLPFDEEDLYRFPDPIFPPITIPHIPKFLPFDEDEDTPWSDFPTFGGEALLGGAFLGDGTKHSFPYTKMRTDDHDTFGVLYPRASYDLRPQMPKRKCKNKRCPKRVFQ